MKTTVFGVLVIAAAAASAQASSRGITVSWEPIPEDSEYVLRNEYSSVFSAMASPFAALAAASGPLGFDDYQSTFTDGPEFALQSMRFVGGVTTAGSAMIFEFQNPDMSVANTATVNLPQAGNFIWTIRFDSAVGAKDSDFFIPANGFLALSTAAETTGQWYLSTELPTIGTESREEGQGTATTHSHRFELNVPAPGALAVLGLGGLALARRRR